jgi:hypothetical protein
MWVQGLGEGLEGNRKKINKRKVRAAVVHRSAVLRMRSRREVIEQLSKMVSATFLHRFRATEL